MPRKLLIATPFPSSRKDSKSKPEKADMPPHIPRITRLKVQIKKEKRIQKVCAFIIFLCRGICPPRAAGGA